MIFLIFEQPGIDSFDRSQVERTFTRIGAPIAQHKTDGPTTALSFLGINIDTAEFKLSLPVDKIQRLQVLLYQWRSRKSCTRRELESFIGHLSHAATVIRPGRSFLRPLYSLLSVVSNPSHFVWLNVEVRADIAWWQVLLQHWNGCALFPLPSPSHHIYSDASGSFGCGAVNTNLNSWFQLQCPQAWEDVGIAAKELVPIVVAAVLWGPAWNNSHIRFHSDNEAVVTVIQKRHAKHPVLTHLLRGLYFCSSVYLFHFSASHVSGSLNVIADAILRNHLAILHSLIPQATQEMIPTAVSMFLLSLPQWGSPNWTEQFVHSLP